MSQLHIPYIDADEVFALLSPLEAVQAVETALLGGLDPSKDCPRGVVPVRNGQFLLMPADSGAVAGVKVATVSPGNAALSIPRIQGVYVLFDAQTLTPTAILDGTALTTLRTAAVSVAAARLFLERRPGPLNVVVYGTGPQGVAHVRSLMALESLHIQRVTHVVRTPRAVKNYPNIVLRVCLTASVDEAHALQNADVVICATSAKEPLFDSALLHRNPVVIAVGSHEPDAREVDSNFLARAVVVVEDVDTALRECGDVIIAAAEGRIDASKLVPMTAVIKGEVDPPGGPILFKSSGMSWEDLVVAEAVAARQVGIHAEPVSP
ncbi:MULTISPECIES: ornithine cyclodeaminase family protein [unclassified Pseudarthrobacter]|uniref:ornithine cyclodeaminase family protein n=1 Tax=unclassified Pseudarthrobacter TaxID=2647000 RepID=UPI0030776AE7